jgi:hypothetical protein
MKLETINWPVFKLGSKEPKQNTGIIYYINETFDKNNNLITNIKIIDDKNIQAPTLGLRRLNINKNKLQKISTAIYTLQDLIKLATKSMWFIDNSGVIFKYLKSRRAKLQIFKIKQVLPVNGIGCVLEVEGFAERFKSLLVPKGEKYAAILQYNGKNLLYGLSNEKIKASWKLI